ncbi:MAG: hypothetical protein R3F34_03210 [Planctomycetota bacterium]
MLVLYPIVPWLGVMACGYGFAPRLERARPERRRLCIAIGVVATLLFVVVRLLRGHGNHPEALFESGFELSWASFLACQKYPPSLAFLLMTLGPALVALGLLDREPGWIQRRFTTFGRVALFFYVAHLFVVHEGARVLFWIVGGEPLSPVREARAENCRRGTTSRCGCPTSRPPSPCSRSTRSARGSQA